MTDETVPKAPVEAGAAVSAAPPGEPRAGVALALAFLAAAAVYAVAVHFANARYPEDDAFIIYRYVDNLVAGHGLVYNLGQRVFGASTPLYIALLALAKLVLRGAATPDIAVRLNAFLFVAAGLGLWLLLRRLTGRAALAALLAGLFLVREDMLDVSVGGMETFLFVALMLFSLWALAGRRFGLAALLAGISVPVRIEGVLLCLVVLAVSLAMDRRRAVPVLAGLVLPGLAWVVFGFAYYGTPVYQSIIAKGRPLYPLPPGHALGRLFQIGEHYVLGNMALRTAEMPDSGWRPTALTLVFTALTGLAAWGLAVPDRTGDRRSRSRLAAPLLLALMLVFYLAANPLLFWWYVPPVAVLWYLVVATGFLRLGRNAGPRWLRAAAVAALVAWSGLLALRTPVTRVLAGRPLVDIAVEANPARTRIVAYRAAAEWLNQVVPDGVAVVGPEVGSLGYYYKGPLVDACGLVSPEAVPFLPVPMSERFSAACGAVSREMVRQLYPDVVVTMGTFAGMSLYNDPWFKQSYIKVRTFDLPRPAWNTPTVDVFFRADRVAR